MPLSRPASSVFPASAGSNRLMFRAAAPKVYLADPGKRWAQWPRHFVSQLVAGVHTFCLSPKSFMSERPHFYRLRRALRHVWEALPPFPVLPSPADLYSWVRRRWRYWSLPSLPSQQAFRGFWRNARDQVSLPPLPKIPSFRNIFSTESLPPLPKIPSLKNISLSIKRGGEAALPGLLPVESAKEVVSTLKTEARVRAFVMVWSLIAVIGVGLWFSAGPLSRRVKGWQSRRLAAQAESLMDEGDVTKAVLKARAAYDLRETEPAAWHAVARVLTKADHGAQALTWWARVAASSGLSVSDRRDYAAAALSAGDLLLASEQIDFLLGQPGTPAVGDLLLAARLATVRGYSAGAVRYAEKVLAHPHVTATESLDAIEDLLVNAAAQSSSYIKAMDNLSLLARSDDNAVSLHALRLIASEPRRPRLSDSRSLVQPAVTRRGDDNFPSAREMAERIESNPTARPYDHLLAVDLRAQYEPWLAQRDADTVIDTFSRGDEQTLIALGGWLYDHGRFDSVLQVITMERASHSRSLFVERVDALYALGRFSELADMVGAENSILDPSLQHLLLAIARSKLGEASASENEWERAVETAETEQQYLAIAEFAEKNGVPKTADAAYAALLFKQPHLRAAYMARLHLAQTAGDTAAAHDLATKILSYGPRIRRRKCLASTSASFSNLRRRMQGRRRKRQPHFSNIIHEISVLPWSPRLRT